MWYLFLLHRLVNATAKATSRISEQTECLRLLKDVYWETKAQRPLRRRNESRKTKKFEIFKRQTTSRRTFWYRDFYYRYELNTITNDTRTDFKNHKLREKIKLEPKNGEKRKKKQGKILKILKSYRNRRLEHKMISDNWREITLRRLVKEARRSKFLPSINLF